jgi:hypothetical protein
MNRITWLHACSVGLLIASGLASAATPLGPPLRLDASPADALPYGVSLAQSANGGFVAAWRRGSGDPAQHGTYTRRFAADGSPQAAETRLDPELEFPQQLDRGRPAVASAPDGSYVVAWRNNEYGGSDSIQGRRFSADGSPLGSLFVAGTHRNSLTSTEEAPAIAMNAQGDFVLAWRQHVRIALGDPLVTPVYGSLETTTVYARRYAADGTPRGARITVSGDLPDLVFGSQRAGVHRSPDVAIDAAGNFVVAWANSESASKRSRIWLRRYSASGVPGLAQRVDTGSGGRTLPSVAMDAAGNALVAWIDNPPLLDQAGSVHARRYGAHGRPLGDPFRVDDGSALRPDSPQAAILSDGRLVVAWQGNAIMAQEYSAAGAALGGNVLVGDTSSFAPLPVVSADGSGGFAVGWNDGVGASAAIMARRYIAP